MIEKIPDLGIEHNRTLNLDVAGSDPVGSEVLPYFCSSQY